MPTERYYRGWIPPEGSEAVDPSTSLRIYNSLTDRKEVFVPKGGPGSKQITWYSCGPTVYDSAHMGHSRNYVTIDIVRRILEDYFGYSVLFVMNITDVEDKIVLRARRNHLLAQYQARATSVAQVKQDAEGAVADSLAKQRTATQAVREQAGEARAAEAAAEEAAQAAKSTGDADQASAAQQALKKQVRQVKDLQAALEGEEHKLRQLEAVAAQLQAEFPAAAARADAGDVAGGIAHLIGVAGDQLALWQDGLHKAEVTDERIFTQHAQRFEAEFWADMDALGNRRPSVTTRVTEYMPQIVAYIQQIMDNGFAYASTAGGEGALDNGNDGRDLSVYFDTVAFERSGHTYAKLNPWAAGSSALAAEGEANFATSEKRSPKDFALWKAAKPGEPTWPSPWGRGRPGWHIECSAMASSVIGAKVDIHTGGEDLRFPHHDNELAQAEAFYHREPGCGCGRAQWVNYFMHSGHLSIEGLKMSKSLKNFITIRQALKDFSARQLRLMFALQPWNSGMMFGAAMREEMRAKERVFKHFFQNVDVLLRKGGEPVVREEAEAELEARITEARSAVHEALLDNLGTAGALEALVRLINATNRYMLARETQQGAPGGGPAPHPELLQQSAGFVTRILKVFGISAAGEGQLGLGGPGLTASREQLQAVLTDFRASLAQHPELQQLCGCLQLDGRQAMADGDEPCAEAVLDALTELRARVRNCAKQRRGDKALPHADRARLGVVLEHCDAMRDDTMVALGVRMEDRPDGSSVWMAEDPAELRAEAAERRQAAAAAELLRLEKALPERQRLLAKVEKQAALPTVQQALGGQYSRFDGQGQAANPTHDAAGNELAPEAAKKGRSAADKARKARAFHDKQVAEKGPGYLDDLRREIASLSLRIEEEKARLRS